MATSAAVTPQEALRLSGTVTFFCASFSFLSLGWAHYQGTESCVQVLQPLQQTHAMVYLHYALPIQSLRAAGTTSEHRDLTMSHGPPHQGGNLLVTCVEEEEKKLPVHLDDRLCPGACSWAQDYSIDRGVANKQHKTHSQPECCGSTFQVSAAKLGTCRANLVLPEQPVLSMAS